jgi:predicted NBD/HSP70 family sugar kinase
MAVANRDLMRAINRFTILNTIRNKGLASRVDVSRSSGLSQAAITGITADLIAEGLLIEERRGDSGGGRRPILLGLNPSGAYTVGVHLSINHVSVVLVNLQAEVVASHIIPLKHPEPSPDDCSQMVISAIQACLWEARFTLDQLSGVGIAMPGLIDSRTGLVRYLPNYKWKDVAFAQQIAKQLKIPVYIENSANTLVIFEQWFGYGRGVDNFILITTEFGIGMGMVINGQLFRGTRGIAGEFGHTTVDLEGPLCRCGQRGCLEAICGNNAILRDAKKAAQQGLWEPSDLNSLTIEDVVKAAKKGEPCLMDIYQRVGRTLGIGIINLQKMFDPEIIIISGKGVLAGDLLFKPMDDVIDRDVFFRDDSAVQIKVQLWEQLHYAKGAGALVLQEVYKSPANRVRPII